MYLNTELIREFVSKQHMDSEDRLAQWLCIVEETTELRETLYFRETKSVVLEEIVDVLITLLVYAELEGLLDKVSDALEKKMHVNLQKPVRIGRGKVKKE